MNQDEVVKVIDAGGRYGIHPSWKSWNAKMHYVMFEPDRDEAGRLSRG